MPHMESGMNVLEWVERLGGWGALLVIVRWMLTRLDATLESVQYTQAQIVRAMANMERSLEEIADNTQRMQNDNAA